MVAASAAYIEDQSALERFNVIANARPFQVGSPFGLDELVKKPSGTLAPGLELNKCLVGARVVPLAKGYPTCQRKQPVNCSSTLRDKIFGKSSIAPNQLTRRLS